MLMKTLTSKPGFRHYLGFSLLLGFTSIATQIIVLRELLSLFYGNELVIGLILTNWMLLTGLGALAGKISDKINTSSYFIFIAFLFYAILPFLITFLAYFLRSELFVYGTMVNIFQVFYTSFLLLLPFCLVSGFLFTYLSYAVSDIKQNNYISKVYSWESMGSIGGGVLFNLVLFWFFDTFESLIFLALLNLMVCLIMAIQLKKNLIVGFAGLLIAGFVLFLLFTEPDRYSRSLLYKQQEITYFRSTPYGNITVTKTSGQVNVYENNLLLFSSQQPVQLEEKVHFPLSQVVSPDNILVLSGGITSISHEINKYKVDRIDYVEINPWLIQAEQFVFGEELPGNVHVAKEDARYFVENVQQKYNAVLINLPEPSNAQVNRFYTHEFYQELEKRLTREGVVAFSLSGSSTYLSEESRALYSSIYRTLRKTFQHVIIVPGSSNYFLASNHKLTWDITGQIHKKGLKTNYVNRYYIDDQLVQRRGEEIMGLLNTDIPVNRDFEPVTYLMKLKQWTSQFHFNYWMPFYVVLFVMFFLFMRVHPVNLVMFTGGFAGASIEVILLIAFQVLYGYVYNLVGVIVTVFMTGLALGTYYRHRIVKGVTISNFQRLQLWIAIYSFALPLLLLLFKTLHVHPDVIPYLFIFLMFVISFLVGMLFSLASQLQIKRIVKIASGVYSIDLIGAAMGSFLTTAYLIPRLGLINICLIIGLLVLLTMLFFYVRFRAG
mgnify:CR=1 FL=1